MDTLVDASRDTDVTAALRKLYFLRFAFAAVWAGLLFATADTLTPLSGALLVIYPFSTRRVPSSTPGPPRRTTARCATCT